MESNVGTWEVGSRSHRHIKLTSTYGTILTEHVLNAGRKTSKRQENPHITRQERKKKKRRELGWDLRPWEGVVTEEWFLGGPSVAGRPAGKRGRFGGQTLRGGRRLAAWGEPEGAGVWCPLPGEHRKQPGCQRGRAPSLGSAGPPQELLSGSRG